MTKTAKVLYDKSINQYGHILNGDLYHASLPHLYPLTATIELLAEKGVNESEKENLLENYELIEIDITPSGKYSTLLQSLREKAIENIIQDGEDLDKIFMISGNNSYSRRDIAEGIKNETEFGVEMLSKLITLTIDLVSRGKEKL